MVQAHRYAIDLPSGLVRMLRNDTADTDDPVAVIGWSLEVPW